MKGRKGGRKKERWAQVCKKYVSAWGWSLGNCNRVLPDTGTVQSKLEWPHRGDSCIKQDGRVDVMASDDLLLISPWVAPSQEVHLRKSRHSCLIFCPLWVSCFSSPRHWPWGSMEKGIGTRCPSGTSKRSLRCLGDIFWLCWEEGIQHSTKKTQGQCTHSKHTHFHNHETYRASNGATTGVARGNAAAALSMASTTSAGQRQTNTATLGI